MTSDGRPIAVIPGSTRRGSINAALGREIVAALVAAEQPAEFIDLAAYPMPIYDGDLEDAYGVPQPAVALHDRLAVAGGVVLVSPEHNGGPSALLKNAIDWISRVDLAVLRANPIGIGVATPGGRGGLTLRRFWDLWITHIGSQKISEEMVIANAGDAFDADGRLQRSHDQIALQRFVDAVIAKRTVDAPSDP